MQTTIKHLFQVPALEDVPRERLESFVEEYPFFGYGHYLLTRKLRAENSDEFTGTTAKTSLYFSNPFWLEWLLVNAPEAKTTDYAANNGGGVETSTPEPEEKDILSTPEMLVELETPQRATTPAEAEPGLVEVQETEHSVFQVEETAAPGIEAPAAELESTTQQLLNNIEEARLLRESLQKINEDFHTHILPVEEPIHDEEPPFVLEEQEMTTPIGEVSVPEPPAPAEEFAPMPVAEAPTGPVAEIPAPAEEAVAIAPTAPHEPHEPALTFEPYHTIDYFASQGIKLTVDENPSDQLGKQLKSFTEWLRVMRRLPQKEKEIVQNRVAEQEVQSIAAHSIEGKEVLTETMAEVLAKQGMPERARIVYEKLSLLNPGKSAYFAAKIEQLNSH
jgi:hypothetical protein